MPISDVYVARTATGGTSVTASTATAILSLFGTAAKRLWVTGIRIDNGATLAAAGASILWQLARPGNTCTGTGLASGNPHDYYALASIGQQALAWSTAPTLGTVLWEQELPMTSGSSWEEFPPTGYEWQVPGIANGSANAGLHVLVTPTVATAILCIANMIWSE